MGLECIVEEMISSAGLSISALMVRVADCCNNKKSQIPTDNCNKGLFYIMFKVQCRSIEYTLHKQSFKDLDSFNFFFSSSLFKSLNFLYQPTTDGERKRGIFIHRNRHTLLPLTFHCLNISHKSTPAKYGNVLPLCSGWKGKHGNW